MHRRPPDLRPPLHYREEGARGAARPHRQFDPAPPRPQARVQAAQALQLDQEGRRAQIRYPARDPSEGGGRQAARSQGGQNPAPRHAAHAPAQAAQDGDQEDAPDEGQGGGGRVREAPCRPREGGQGEEDGEGVAEAVAARFAAQGLSVRRRAEARAASHESGNGAAGARPGRGRAGCACWPHGLAGRARRASCRAVACRVI
mmetsp:Transcript_10469/g.33015  ORF Transcript_10469/g.33015 Transcript_10469/m.33015 type:complete len:202 (+) Transcript_10469:348-953(+)